MPMSEYTDGPSKLIRVNSALWAGISDLAETSGRSPRQELESHLRQILEKDRPANLSPAQALGKVVELHAADIIPYCQSAKEWHQEMRSSVPALMAELFETADQAGSSNLEGFAELAARSLARKVLAAHLRREPAGDFFSAAAEHSEASTRQFSGRVGQEELLGIEAALELVPPRAGKGSSKAPNNGPETST